MPRPSRRGAAGQSLVVARRSVGARRRLLGADRRVRAKIGARKRDVSFAAFLRSRRDAHAAPARARVQFRGGLSRRARGPYERARAPQADGTGAGGRHRQSPVPLRRRPGRAHRMAPRRPRSARVELRLGIAVARRAVVAALRHRSNAARAHRTTERIRASRARHHDPDRRLEGAARSGRRDPFRSAAARERATRWRRSKRVTS